MFTKEKVIRRPQQMAGEYRIEKSGSGRDRVRLLVFRTVDGHEGVSRTWKRQEAYDNALKNRAAALAARSSVLPTPTEPKPAPSARMLHTLHESDLCAELERRGYAVCPAELVGLDRNGDALAMAGALA